MKKTIVIPLLILLSAVIVLTSCSGAGGDKQPSSQAYSEGSASENTGIDSITVPDIEAGIEEINKYGNIILSVSAESLRNQGYEPGDVIRVRIGNIEKEMPIGTNYANVDYDAPICCFKVSSTKGIEVVTLAVNGGNLAEVLGIAEIQSIEADPGYEVIWADGYDPSVPVKISMAEKQGYAEEYHQREYGNSRSNNRSDYSQLSDMQYANFRAVSTSGMGDDILYRSSSPIDPSLNRSREADVALSDALVRTVLNLTDAEEAMTQYPEYYQTAYSDCDIIALNMSMDFNTDEMNQKLAEGLRFMASHDGPYLIHCKEGKDRTGYVCGVLEALMGASADEIVADYMLTYYNFFGTEPGTEQYQKIADNGIRPILADVFGVDSIEAPGLDLSLLAEEYLQRIGMSSEEITALKNNLSRTPE